MDHKELPIYHKKQIVNKLWCDSDDYEFLKNFNIIYVDYHGQFPYPAFKRDGKYIKVHRWVMGVRDPSILVDHVNHMTNDARKKNLRLVSRSQNAQNRSPNHKVGKSGYRNVRKHTLVNKWVASIMYNYKTYTFGLYDSPEEANKVAMTKRKEFGFLDNTGEGSSKTTEEMEGLLSEYAVQKIRRDNKSGYSGIHYQTSKKNGDRWYVKIANNYIGTYNNLNEAINARINKKIELNIPLDIKELEFQKNNHVSK